MSNRRHPPITVNDRLGAPGTYLKNITSDTCGRFIKLCEIIGTIAY